MICLSVWKNITIIIILWTIFIEEFNLTFTKQFHFIMRLVRLIQDILPLLQERSDLLEIQIQSIRSSFIMQ